MKFAIIGAGMAGLSCATVLSNRGHIVAMFDKGRGPGGRMASRSLSAPFGVVSFDMGAQYFTARDPDFSAEVKLWMASGDVASWDITDEGAYIGVPTMNAPLKRIAQGLDVTWGVRIGAMRRSGNLWTLQAEAGNSGAYDAVVCALPAEQAHVFLEPHEPVFSALASQTHSAPCWTLMAAFSAPLEMPDVIKSRGIIDFASRNSAKPGRDGVEAWVIHATADWSRMYLEGEAQSVEAALLQALAAETGHKLPTLLAASVHRWRYARSGKAKNDKSRAGHLWSVSLGIGVCGDWLLGPRVENAWVSGSRLGVAMAENYRRVS